MQTETLTIEQENKVYTNRLNVINKANEKKFFVMFGNLKLPAKLAGNKLAYPVAYSGNYCTEISWKLAERIANGECKVIN
jgi:hypothetical protein